MKLFTTAILFVAITATSAGSYGGFRAGQYLTTRSHESGDRKERIERERLEIKNNCAHYDMETAEFTWGSRPQILVMDIPVKERK